MSVTAGMTKGQEASTAPAPEVLPARPRRAMKATIVHNVYSRLREELAVGHFDPGQKLTIDHLAKVFETSHMPVREALRHLAAERAIDITSGGSALVPPVAEERLDELCEARLEVEGALAALAASRADTSDIERLHTLIAAHEAAAGADDAIGMLAHNRNFHGALYATARSRSLADLADNLWLRFGPFMGMLSRHILPRARRGDLNAYTGHHRGIVAAIEMRNPGLCEVELRADIEATRELLRPLCTATDPTLAEATPARRKR